MSAPTRPRLSALRPKPVVNAIRLMYAGVVLALIGVLVNALSRGSIARALERTNDGRSPGDRLSADDLQHAADLTYTAFLAMSIAATVVWLVMAVANSRGLGWARIVSTVLVVLNLLLTIGMATRGTAATAIAEVPTLLVGAAAVWLLWQPASTTFFERCAGLRHPA
ncbi:hypothetical protein [Flexivirga endophytica]|uniref:hypothetical protein n=1 Tax=Flexivirga endophytica TaxID=1849103 RepID=UPI00166F387A|nr:hypothetical protein [Flexivirga endophytica]GHB68962.1 hypothetical protein GCM10008112_42140 [Flexivirga endophytica]